ncbi:MAG TPA: VWA domain-containing protein [Thermoanaerobaculia bacterium]|nr:VWA domain-containing protein [Thermoanaerobaculia bacterium]
MSLPAGSFPHLDDPLWLLALALVPLLAWRHHLNSGLGALRYSRLPSRGRPRRGLGSGWRLHLPFYARLAALALMVAALARPQLGYAIEESQTEGIDIQMALDISGSMAAIDYQPKNRLTVAKQVVGEFIDRRPSDRIGLVTFAGQAMARAPLTTDREMLHRVIEAVDFNDVPDGTAIGVALANAAARLRQSGAESRVIVLVTDGANNAGEIDPISAAAVCAGLGIKVYTIGVGSAGSGPVLVPFPLVDPFGRRVERMVPMNLPVDEKLLGTIARRTGGRFWKATDAASLRATLGEIDRLEKTELKTKRSVHYREAAAPFVWSSLSLLLLPLAAAGARWTAEP